MTEQNATHSPRVDDLLARESIPVTHGAPDDAGAEVEVDPRSRLAACLLPSAFPATGQVLARVAEENEAPPDKVTALRSMPVGQVYESFAEVWVDLGGEIEHRT